MTTSDSVELSGHGLTEDTRERLDQELEVLRSQRAALDTGGDELGVGDRADDAEALRRRDDAQKIDERISEINRMLYTGEALVETDAEGLPDGSTITLRHGDGAVETLRAVAITEAVPEGEEDSSLTLDSPLGRAIAGHKPGDTVSYETPEGTRRAEIVEIHPPRR
ncbi:MAG TPA: GreA/GreB family elongation factor [Pseudonocardia sp.]|jgi:transcription elongation GreA/GreB family factor